jgi:transposase InsO family protein
MEWVSGIAYLRTVNGWVYLTAVLDLFGRKTIGRATSAGMETTHAAVAALAMAFKNRRPQGGLVFHSGRGVRYCAQPFRSVLRENCPMARQSMRRKGDCWDSACGIIFQNA